MSTEGKMPLKARESFLPFALPSIGEEEIAEVADSMRSGWITTGPKTRRFEDAFQKYISAKHAIAVNSCTAGLHVVLAALGIGSGDEVLVPTLTFCATANVVVHLGGRPVLVDVGDDFNVSPDALEANITPRTKAIMIVHYAGQACDLDAVYKVASRHNLPIVEDAAHAVGANYHCWKIGSDDLQREISGLRRVTVFSFYATKNMTTGEGGMITTKDDALASRMRLLVLHGMSKDAWKRYTDSGSWFYEVIEAGYKDNMTDIQAAMGIQQLRKLDGFIKVRQHYASIYNKAFSDQFGVMIPTVHSDRDHAYHLYAIRLKAQELQIDRGQFIEELKRRNIGASVHFIPVHLHPFYRQRFGYKRGDFPCAEQIYDSVLSLPLYPRMTEADVKDVIQSVCEILSEFGK